MNLALALIFNLHENADSVCSHHKSQLIPALKDCGFEVNYHEGCSLSEFLEILEKVEREDHSKRHSIWVFVFSPGSAGRITINDTSFEINLLLQHFAGVRCVTYIDIPKIFVIQSGDNRFLKFKSILDKLDLSCDPTFNLSIPPDENLFVFYSSLIADCMIEKNSCFSKAFCKKLELVDKIGITDLFQFITSTLIKESFDCFYNYHKGVPICYSTLTKRFTLSKIL